MRKFRDFSEPFAFGMASNRIYSFISAALDKNLFPKRPGATRREATSLLGDMG
jgi:hypothetical protein